MNIILISTTVLFLFYVETTEGIDEVKHLVGKLSAEDRSSSALPCLCEKNNYDASSRHKSTTGTAKEHLHHYTYTPHIIGRNSPENHRIFDTMDPRERKERLDEAAARFMQLMTIFGHVDHFLTQKTSGLLKTMGRAVGGEDYEEEYVPRYRPTRRTAPETTTISSR